MTIKCAAVIGQANNPLYLEAFEATSEEEILQFHHIVHCSLDAVEGKSFQKKATWHVVAAPRRSPGESADCYLGMLYPTEDHKVFGQVFLSRVVRFKPIKKADLALGRELPFEASNLYVSNTKIKFMLVLSEPIPKDDELRMIFRRFHAAYVDAASNPFYTLNTAIASRSFDASVRTIITTV